VSDNSTTETAIPDDVESVAYDSRDKPYKGFHVRASYLKRPNDGDARIEIFRDGNLVRSFKYPAYRIYNIAAHFTEIVDGELEESESGYEAANFNGFTTSGRPVNE
jgi:hypothetical protein